MALKTPAEKERGYSDASYELLQRMERASLRIPQPLHKQNVEDILTQVYTYCGLEIPRYVWCTDIRGDNFIAAITASAVRVARVARAARAASAVRAAWAASAAITANAASTASTASTASAVITARTVSAVRAARTASAVSVDSSTAWAAVDYDFDYFLELYEYSQHAKGNENDAKALYIYETFLEAKEHGLGYLAENDGALYLVPTPEVRVDNEQRFHSTEFSSIAWKDGLEMFHLHGVLFSKELWQKIVSRSLSFEEILAIKDVDQRTQAMRFADVQKFLEYSNAQKLDEYDKFTPEGERVNYQLIMIPKGDIFPEDAYYAYFDCPSTREKHFEGVEKCSTAAEAMCWRGYNLLTPEEWKLQVPLVHEM